MGDKMAVFIQWFTTWIACYVMAFTTSWKLSLVAAVSSPLLIINGAELVKVMRKMASQEAQAYAKAGAVAEQAFRSIRTVQAFQGQDIEIARYDHNLDYAIKVASKQGIALGLGNSAAWFLFFLTYAGVIWFGTYLIQEDNLPPGKILPVLIDGHDIRSLNVKWLRSNIGVVSQEPSLFDATIEENIRFGKLDATEAEIQNAAKEANAHDFIVHLPEGYKTNVGELGVQLSGGQKQRISIARALVRNPKILLLDEATSALDQESEAIVQNALVKAQIGRTTITIAHRLSTVRYSDKIVALNDGKVFEEGTHVELLQAKGLYSRLVHLQAQIKAETVTGHETYREIEQDKGLNEKNSKNTVMKISLRSILNTPCEIAEKETLSSETNVKENISRTMKLTKVTEDDHSDISILKELLRINAPEWFLILFGCLGSVVAGCIMPIYSFFLGEYIKLFAISDHSEQWYGANILGGALLTARLRKLTFASLINQDMGYFDNPSSHFGALTSKLSGDAALVQGATGSKIVLMLEAASTILCSLLIAFIAGWKLTLVVLAFMPLMIIGGFIQGKAIAGSSKKDRKLMEQAGKTFSEVVDSIRTVVSLGREDHFVKTFNELLAPFKLSNRKMSFVFGITYGIANCTIYFGLAVTFYYGAVLVNEKEMEFYNVFRVFSAILLGGLTLGNQSSYGVDYTKAKVAGRCLLELINRKPKIDVRDIGRLKMDEFNGNITFDNVSLTLEKMLPLLVLVAVLVNGIDLHSLNLKWYRSQLGIVSQEPTLFDCSIAEDIAYGDNSRVVPMTEIIQAAKDANIHNFIASLPQGYDTSVGENGAQLSGGQKQRIAIARALVRHPKVLLLDEATSALDAESEKVVQKALDRACQNRTCITIAHRLSTIQNADKIAVINNGKVTEIGNHHQLLAMKGAYYRLLMSQNREH
ncbi:ATP-binding cassette, sub-B (MDR TAP), member 4 [Bulinus truncatus]|nr:ATP-binding cassette, sub-B (MDR TAP), member 4 [Bulinus truncatus]